MSELCKCMPILAALLLLVLHSVNGLASPDSSGRTTSVITGASGYVGRAVASTLLQHDNEGDILCLVRPPRVDSETEHWEDEACVKVLPYDMLDGGTTLRDALKSAPSGDGICVYHVASWFAPSEDHEQMAKNNVKGTEDLVRVLAEFPNCKLVLTSSMAAVRATTQTPKNGKYYTSEDWNTESKLGANWGASYQWSKAESEKQAWALSNELNVPMVSLCPSFVFGPPYTNEMTSSFSTELVGQWIQGKSQVQSRLFVDVRDVAEAHVAAGTLPQAIGKRYILSTERRLASQKVAEIFQNICHYSGFGDPNAISFDADFTGGAIPIGEKEVDAEEILKKDLGLTLLDPEDTMADMGEFLVEHLSS